MRQLEDQRQQARRTEVIGTLIRGIAHNLNSVLSPIIVHTEIAKKDIPAESPLQENLDQILTASDRAIDLVKQILAYSRQGKYELQPLKTGFIVREVIHLLRATTPASIKLNYDIQTEKDMICADPVQIHQVILSLCANILHFMKGHAAELKITLADAEIMPELLAENSDLSQDNLYLKLEVTNSEKCISHEWIDEVFDINSMTREKSEDAGIDFVDIHGIVKKYGGSISVKGGTGEGIFFELWIPKARVENEKISKTKKTIPGGEEHILFIDDEKGLVDAIVPMLERLGYYITSTTNTIEALEVFRKDPDRFDLIITDQKMPFMMGDRLATEMIKIRNDIPVIICTGYSENIDEKTAKEIGISKLMMKPITKRKIAHTIRDVLEKSNQACQ